MITFLKRIVWFLALNLAIILTISLVLQALGIQGYLSYKGINYNHLFVIALVVGFTGSFISLQLSRFLAKSMMGVRVIDVNSPNLPSRERELVQSVYALASKAGLPKMPEVGIYPSPEINAFATGPSRSCSLVAVSEGLLSTMNTQELEGVLAHEVAHIANGDMVTMTLLQGVVNTFVYFIARVLAYVLSRQDEEKSPQISYGLVFLFEIVLGILGLIILASFSRFREYRADRDGALLAGSSSMLAALKKLQLISQNPQWVEAPESTAQSFSAFKINRRTYGLAKLFSTHPPLEKRIERLLNSSRSRM